jgi:hypothetical protein
MRYQNQGLIESYEEIQLLPQNQHFAQLDSLRKKNQSPNFEFNELAKSFALTCWLSIYDY